MSEENINIATKEYADAHFGKGTNYQNSTEIADLLNTTTPIAAANYSYKGWTITVQA